MIDNIYVQIYLCIHFHSQADTLGRKLKKIILEIYMNINSLMQIDIKIIER